MKNQKLLFVYNADSGLFNIVSDFAHKIISPRTYACDLCALTYGNFTMKHEWKTFLNALPLSVSFMYKNEFVKQYNLAIELPAVFIQSDHDLHVLISKQGIEGCEDLQQLKQLLTSRLNSFFDSK